MTIPRLELTLDLLWIVHFFLISVFVIKIVHQSSWWITSVNSVAELPSNFDACIFLKFVSDGKHIQPIQHNSTVISEPQPIERWLCRRCNKGIYLKAYLLWTLQALHWSFPITSCKNRRWKSLSSKKNPLQKNSNVFHLSDFVK